MRTMENKVHMDGYRTFGIMPTPMAFPEVFAALQQGTVDGQENPIPVIICLQVLAGAEAPVADWPRLLAGAAADVAARSSNKLSEADKKVFLEAAKAAPRRAAQEGRRGRRQRHRADGKGRHEGRRKASTGNAFQDALKPAYAQFAKEFGADNIKKIQEVK